MPIARLLLIPLLVAPAAFAQAWTPSVRTEVRVIQDSNVFLQDDTPLAAGQTQRGTPVAADDQEFVAGAAIALARQPAGGASADLGYAVEWHRFAEQTGESHVDHRFTAGSKWTKSDWSAEAKGSLLEVDGSHTPPVYNELGGLPAMAGEPVRSRRAQTVVNASATVTERLSSAWQVRALATLLSQDFHTTIAAAPYGCANYVDRGQGLVGLEAGRAINPDLTGWLSLRGGRQWQEDLLGRTENFTNTILRPLVGLEGKLAPSVRATLWAGPDRHRFTSERRPGTAATCTLPFVESTVTWAPNPADALTATARHQLWPGSGGRSVYRELKADLTWTHHASNRIDTSLRTGLLHGNFGGFAATGRNDNVFTAGALASRALPGGFKVDGGLTREWTQSCILNTPGRAYARWLMSVGVAKTW